MSSLKGTDFFMRDVLLVLGTLTSVPFIVSKFSKLISCFNAVYYDIDLKQ